MNKWKYSKFDTKEIKRVLKDFRYNQTKYPESPYPDTVNSGIDYWMEKTKQSMKHIDRLETEVENLKEVLKAIKIRIAFIGWPKEPMNKNGPDWIKEIALIEKALKG